MHELRARYEQLTPREREVFAHLISGQLNKQVGFDLGISEQTTKIHRHRVLEKMRADSIADLVRMAADLAIAPMGRIVGPSPVGLRRYRAATASRVLCWRIHMATPAPLIVVVEDDLPTLKALGRVLRAAGFETATYSSAEDYLASPPVEMAHCFLLDIHLGGMSGLDLQRHLSAHGSHLPVIVMTAFDDAHVRDEANENGVRRLSGQGTDIDVLLSLISRSPSGPRDSTKAL